MSTCCFLMKSSMPYPSFSRRLLITTSMLPYHLIPLRQLSNDANRLLLSLKTSRQSLGDLPIFANSKIISPESLENFIKSQNLLLNDEDINSFFASFPGNLQSALALDAFQNFLDQFSKDKESSVTSDRKQEQQNQKPSYQPNSSSQYHTANQSSSPYESLNKSEQKQKLESSSKKPTSQINTPSKQENSQSQLDSLYQKQRQLELDLQVQKLRELELLERRSLVYPPIYAIPPPLSPYYAPYYVYPSPTASRIALLEAEQRSLDYFLAQEKAIEQQRRNSQERLKKIEEEYQKNLIEQSKIRQSIVQEEQKKRDQLNLTRDLLLQTDDQIRSKIEKTQNLRKSNADSRLKYFDPKDQYPYGIIIAINNYDSPQKSSVWKQDKEKLSSVKESDESRKLDDIPQKSQQASKRSSQREFQQQAMP